MGKEYPDFFNDVFGPVMQPGSSSHMAAPCRIGLLARALLGEEPVEACFIMDRQGSFAGTFGCMNEDKGMLAGVLGIGPEDERLYDVYALARLNGLEYRFIFDEMKESSHLNALKVMLKSGNGKIAALVADSTGGGMVRVRKINGFDVNLIGDTHVVFIFTAITSLQIRKLVDAVGGYIGKKTITDGGTTLVYIKFSQQPDITRIRNLLPDVQIEFFSPILPVTMKKGRKKQLFKSVAEWRLISEQSGVGMCETAVQYETDSSLWTKEQVITYMEHLKGILTRQITAAYDGVNVVHTPFYRYDSGLWLDYQSRGRVLGGPVMSEVIKRAIGVNEKTKKVPIVPGPMGTGGGYLFSALLSVKEAYGFGEGDLLRGLFVAAGIGAISYTHTKPTGEVVGCGGECGVCCSMGAAAIVEMAGGNGVQIENAASLALQAFIGLPCDPVIGGYEVPCFSRVIAASSMAVVYADLALAGCQAIIPYDELLAALNRLGKKMPSELLCTSKGGTCLTPAAKRCAGEFKAWQQNQNDVNGDFNEQAVILPLSQR
jgi:L-serine dehydratase